MIDFGTVRPGTTLYVPFATYDSNDPTASVTMTGLAVTDIEIYKDGSTTQRGSDNGYALLDTDGIDFDGLTGIHGFSIDLADNSTAGFYASGSQYWVVVSSITVDSGTISFIAATFRIGYPDAILNTTIATLASQTSFTLTAGPADNNALVGCVVLIHDVASAVQIEMGVVSAYTGSTKTVTLAADPGVFTAAATDNIAFYFPINTRWLSGTALTGRDIGASVLLSSGTGTGQVTITSGRVNADITHIATAAVSTTTAQLGVNVVQLSGDGTAADNAEAFFDGTGYAGTNNVIPTVTTVGTTTNLTNLPAAAATAAELAKVPKSDGTASWNATALAAINAEVDTALNTAIPGSPTSDSINERIATMDGLLLGTVAAGTHNPQSGDAYARLGAPAGASVSADVAAVKSDTGAVKTKTDYLPSATAGSAGGVFIAGSNAATSITTALTANITGNLSGSVGSVTGAVGSVTGAVGSVTGNVGGNVAGSVASVTAGVTLADDAITAAKFDESTAFPLKSADTGATAVARTGADSDTLETLSDQLDGPVTANITQINSITIDGAGTAGDPWGPAA